MKKIKEYNDEGQLIFEGEYLYGKKNGYAKEFDNKGNCIFEGHCLNGIKNGMVKEKYISTSYCWSCCEINFEREYINGKQNGKVKIYCDGFQIFEEEYLNGEKNGFAKEINYNSNNKSYYEGEYQKGQKIGIRKEYKDGKLISEKEY